MSANFLVFIILSTPSLTWQKLIGPNYRLNLQSSGCGEPPGLVAGELPVPGDPAPAPAPVFLLSRELKKFARTPSLVFAPSGLPGVTSILIGRLGL